ncbi:MAG: class I tRNA ligase family protein, partial [Povalibacter sp.]
KLWNAARYVLMNTEGHDAGFGEGECEFSVPDRWIRSRLGATVEEVRRQLSDYRFDLAAQTLYEFAWYEYCDWYLELCKPALQSDSSSAAQKRGARRTLLEVLEGCMRLLHPFMPFVTEEIWQAVAPLAQRKGETIMLQPYPKSSDFPIDTAAEEAIAPIKAVVLGVRQIRGQLDVARSRQIPVSVKAASAETWNLIESNSALIRSLANLSELAGIDNEANLPPTAMQLIDGHAVHAPLSSLIDDPDAELARLAKQKTKKLQEIGKCEAKLNNQNFVANAPPSVVDQERARITEFRSDIAQIEEQERRVAQLKKAGPQKSA